MPLAVRVKNTNAEAIPTQPANYQRLIGNINQANVTNVFGALKSHIIADQDNWRLDRQNPTGDNEANVQVQRNGMTGKTTAAGVLIAGKYNIAMPAGNAADLAKRTLEYNARLSELAKAVRNALTQSAASWQAHDTKSGRISIYEITGDFSA